MSQPLLFSVVIPTCSRLDSLPLVLFALEQQQKAPPFEVIIIDDGSQDGTSAWLDSRASSVPIQVLKQVHAGPATARNRGLKAARGKWVAFLGDDTIPSPDWLAWHLAAHRQSQTRKEAVAVVGYIGWHWRVQAVVLTAEPRRLCQSGFE